MSKRNYFIRNLIEAIVIVILIMFIITMQGFRLIPKIFFPPSDKAIYTAEIELSIGTPVEYTETTTIAGLMFLWLFGAPMWEPMAIAIIFGLAFCTLLTLGVVPVLYSVFFGVK